MRLCVPIAARTTGEAIRKMNRSFTAPGFSELILELRIDRMKDPDLPALLAQRHGKVIVTNRRKEEGGAFPGTEEERVNILRHAVALGADYVDIEAGTDRNLISGLKREIADQSGAAKLIISYHDFRKTPAERSLRLLLSECAERAPDIVKIATMARSLEDNLKVLRLIPYARRMGLEIVAFCMGHAGRVSRIVSPLMGAYLAFAAANDGERSAPGQMSVTEMVRIFGVLGKEENRTHDREN